MMLTRESCFSRVADAIQRRDWSAFGPGWQEWNNVRNAFAFSVGRAFGYVPERPELSETTTDARTPNLCRYYRHHDGRVMDKLRHWGLWHAFLWIAERPEFYRGDPLDWALRLFPTTL